MSVKCTQSFTATGAGSDIFLGHAYSRHTLQVKWTSNPTAVKVSLQGSLDNGTSWSTIGTFDTADGRVTTDAITVDAAPYDRVRPNLLTLTGGTTPTVTAIVLSDDD